MEKSLKFTRSSRKHRLGRARMLHVINHNKPGIEVNDRGEDEYTWYGSDDRGLWITITGAEVEADVILIFHAQPDYKRNNQ